MCFYHFHSLLCCFFLLLFRLMFFTLLRCLNNTFREGGCGRSERFRNIHLMRMMMLMIRFSLYLWFSFYSGCDGFFGVEMLKCSRYLCNWNYFEVLLAKSSHKSQISFSFNLRLLSFPQSIEILRALKYSRATFALILPLGILPLESFQHRLASDQTCMITLCLTLPSCLIILYMMLSVTCDARHSRRKMLKFNKRWRWSCFNPTAQTQITFWGISRFKTNSSTTPFGLWFPVDCLAESFNPPYGEISFINSQIEF